MTQSFQSSRILCQITTFIAEIFEELKKYAKNGRKLSKEIMIGLDSVT